MVLAVYIPPQPPGPGQAYIKTFHVLSVISPWFHFPMSSKTETVDVFSLWRNGSTIGKIVDIHIGNGNHNQACSVTATDKTKASTLWPPIAASIICDDVTTLGRNVPGVPIAILFATVMSQTAQAAIADLTTFWPLPEIMQECYMAYFLCPLKSLPQSVSSKSRLVIPVARSMARFGDFTILS